MGDLLKSEWRRFLLPAIVLAVVHLFALLFFARMVDPAQQPLLVHRVFGAVYVVVGALLGVYQAMGYRRPASWVQLLHRPLPPVWIAMELALAAMAQLLLVIALPIALLWLWQRGMTPRVVDLRHWLWSLAVLLLGLSGYLAGIVSVLRGVRYALAASLLLSWPLLAHATGIGMLAVQAITCVWLLAMVFVAFRPDLHAAPRGVASTVVVALPLQMAVYVLVLMAFFVLESLWIAQGSHPNNTLQPPAGGHNQVEKMDARTRLLAGLEGSRHPDAPLLREQIKLSDPAAVGLQMHALPQRGELGNVAPMEFDDVRLGQRWVFSHDDMRMHGYRLLDQQAVATLGTGDDNAAFPAPVLPARRLPGMPEGDATLVGGGTLYQYVISERRVWPRIRLQAGETLLGIDLVGESLVAVGDRALYVFDTRAFVEDTTLLQPRMRMPLPAPVGDLHSSPELVELVDGYLVGLLYSAHAHEMGAAPFQVLLRLHEDGRVDVLNRRALKYDYSPLYRYRIWWPSPLLHRLRDAALDLFATPSPLQRSAPESPPASMWWLAGGLSSLALLLAGWHVMRSDLGWSARLGWMAACALGGLPAFASLWLLVPTREHLRPVAALHPASA